MTLRKKTGDLFRRMTGRHSRPRPDNATRVPPDEVGWRVEFWAPCGSDGRGAWMQVTQLKRDPEEVQRILNFCRRKDPDEIQRVVRQETRYVVDDSFATEGVPSDDVDEAIELPAQKSSDV